MPDISLLFSGMETYLAGDIEINNSVTTPSSDGSAEEVEAAAQSAEVASDTADATEEAKDTEVASQMLSRMCDMYDHVKQFGIDRTFVSLYNRHGELDRVCGMRFPSCESMDVVGDRYSQYSTAFIAAMEDEKEGLWTKFKNLVSKIWNWIKNKVSAIWKGIKRLFGFAGKEADDLEKNVDGKSEAELTEAAGRVPESFTEKLLYFTQNAGPTITQLVTASGMFFSMKKEAERADAPTEAAIKEYEAKIKKYKEEYEKSTSWLGKAKAKFMIANNYVGAKTTRAEHTAFTKTARYGYNTVRAFLGLRKIRKQVDTLSDETANVNERVGAAVGLIAKNIDNIRGITGGEINVKIPFTKIKLFTINLNFGKWIIKVASQIGGALTVAFLKWLNVGNKAFRAQ